MWWYNDYKYKGLEAPTDLISEEKKYSKEDIINFLNDFIYEDDTMNIIDESNNDLIKEMIEDVRGKML